MRPNSNLEKVGLGSLDLLNHCIVCSKPVIFSAFIKPLTYVTKITNFFVFLCLDYIYCSINDFHGPLLSLYYIQPELFETLKIELLNIGSFSLISRGSPSTSEPILFLSEPFGQESHLQKA